MYQPQQRASRLRAVALASTVALAIALPLAAAVAGEDARLAAEAAHEPGPKGGAATPGGSPTPSTGEGSPRRSSEGEDDKSLSRLDVPRESGARDTSRPSSSCGPEITSPEGVEAQTCVLTEGGDTWGRTYYRNATNGRLDAVLTLMRPDGRTTQVHCPVPAADEPGVCETPRRPTVRPTEAEGGEPYSAVAEVAPADGERLLLRSGSNSTRGAGS